MLRYVWISAILVVILSAAYAADDDHHHHDHAHGDHSGCSHGKSSSSETAMAAVPPQADGHDHVHGPGCSHGKSGSSENAAAADSKQADNHAHGPGCSHGKSSAHGENATTADSKFGFPTIYLIALAAGLFVPFISFLGNLACRYFKDDVRKFLPLLVSFGAGTMLASSTVSFIPEAVAHSDFGPDPHTGAFLKVGLPILIGMLVSVVMEFVIHSVAGHHHDHDDLGFADVEASKGKHHPEMKAMAWTMLIADAIHNAIDGVLIGTTFMVDLWQGLIITLLIVLHELPQEIAELCILLHAGWPMRKAIIRNCLSTMTILAGVAIGLSLASQFAFLETYCIAFIAGEFLYVSLGQLMPSLARTVMTRRQSILSHLSFVLGVVFICVVTYQFPHSHGNSHAGCSH